MRKCKACGTSLKTVAVSSPSKRRTGEERAAVAAAAPQGIPKSTGSKRFSQVSHSGEGPLSARGSEFINRIDTPRQVISSGPTIMNKGEHIFTIFPRRTDQGRTIRSNEE
jgi:hypothetical protein